MEPPDDISIESRALAAASSIFLRQPPDWDAYRPVIAALAETVFPSIEADVDDADRSWYFEASGSDLFQDEILKTINTMIHPGLQYELALLMEFLQSRGLMLSLGGRLALTRRWPYIQNFLEMDVPTREALLLFWGSSPLGVFRKAVKSFRGVIITTLLTSPGKDGGPNAFSRALGYPGPLKMEERPSVLPEKLKSEKTLLGALLDLSQKEVESVEQLRAALQEHGFMICSPTVEEALENPDVVIQCDAVVVGSGAGGGVTAGVLAEAGMKVVVLEKGSYVPVQQLDLHEGQSLANLYDRGFLLCSEDVAVNCLAGSTVGGGTRVNWCASFRTPEHVRREWASFGLPKFEQRVYDHAMDAVCKRINVNASLTRHSKHNTLLQTGLKALGVHHGEIPRNVVGQHHCGWCCWGCPSGEKQDMTATFLADAAAHGAKILAGVFAERILVQDLKKADGPRKQQAVGVLASDYVNLDGGRGGTKWRIVIRAPLVVSSAGSIHSPALLLRSGITVNDNVGQNLRLHPCTIICGVFDEEPEQKGKGAIRMWEDAPMTVYSRELADWEGSGYGPLVTCPSSHVGIFSQLPWNSGASFKRALADLRNVSPVLVLDRDTSSGRVRIGSSGLPQVYYWPNAFDRENLVKGMELGIRAIVAAGARAVFTLQPAPASRFAVDRLPNGELADPKAFETYLHTVKTEGIQRNRVSVFSAHQMGSCRMGKDEYTSVCDGDGHCWHVAGLYIADASVFPTPSGVNPMVSIESVSYMTAEGIADRFRLQRFT
eukprot:jgi/Botrbrau1/14388/Bobra.0014s0037.1